MLVSCELALKNKKLFKQQAFIGGQWLNADNQEKIEVFNPANQQSIGFIPSMGQAETQKAIIAAERALVVWKNETAHVREKVLLKWRDLIIENIDDLAMILSAENGKPSMEAKGEILYACSFIEWYAEEGKRIYGNTILSPIPDQRIIVIKQAVGVCAAITPWNFPSSMITRKVSPALAAGCTVVVKPAEATPFSALALAVLAEEAGMPAGVLNIVTGNPKVIGEELTRNPTVKKLSFTGSTATGRVLMAGCAPTIKKLSLELGGNSPFIVFDDADIDLAVKSAIQSKFRNAGQACIAGNRFYVQQGIHDQFVNKFLKEVKQLKVAPADDPQAQIGPLINKLAVEKIERLLADAVSKGAQVLLGGKRHALGGSFFETTVLTHVRKDMEITKEEIFGPVAPIISFNDEKELIEAANNTEYGLASYCFGQDIKRIWRCAEALEYGMVGINTHDMAHEVFPFGGVKQSGIGQEGSFYGIEDYVDIKSLLLNLS